MKSTSSEQQKADRSFESLNKDDNGGCEKVMIRLLNPNFTIIPYHSAW